MKLGQKIFDKPLKVVILMTNLEDLGAQRVVINLYNHFNRKIIEPTLVLWSKEGKVASFLDEQEFTYETDHGLKRPKLFFRLFRYIRIIWKVRPDLVLSIVPVTNVSYTLIQRFLPRNIKFIACEHAFISKAVSTGEYYGYFRTLYLLLLRRMYNKVADRLLMVANVAKIDAVENWQINEAKIKVIYNPQDLVDLRKRANEPLDDEWLNNKKHKVFIAVGRLTKQKGFASLLQAFAQVIKQQKAYLLILGRGELESDLKILAAELGVKDSVRFLGFQSNPLAYVSRASFFVLPSIWEAMPMVVAETMAVGTPIIAFDCPSGPKEMLDDGNCGFLVADQDVRALATTMIYAINNPDEAAQKVAKATQRVEMFDVKSIVNEYQELLLNVANKNGN